MGAVGGRKPWALLRKTSHGLLEMLRSLTLEDAHVVMAHNQTTGDLQDGGVFNTTGNVTLHRSNLTAPQLVGRVLSESRSLSPNGQFSNLGPSWGYPT